VLERGFKHPKVFAQWCEKRRPLFHKKPGGPIRGKKAPVPRVPAPSPCLEIHTPDYGIANVFLRFKKEWFPMHPIVPWPHLAQNMGTSLKREAYSIFGFSELPKYLILVKLLVIYQPLHQLPFALS